MLVYHARRKPVFKKEKIVRRFDPSFTVGFEYVETVDEQKMLFITWALPENNYNRVFGRQTVENRLMRMVKIYNSEQDTLNFDNGTVDDIRYYVAQSVSKNIDYYVKKAMKYYKLDRKNIDEFIVYTGEDYYMTGLVNDEKGEINA
jgi:hypothetical protein